MDCLCIHYANSSRDVVPIKETASALSLPTHEIDTFTGWTVSLSDHSKSMHVLIKVASDDPSWSHQFDYCRVIRPLCASAHLERCPLRWSKCASIIAP